VKDGVITITLNDIGTGTKDKTIVFEPAGVNGDAVIWKTTSTVEDKVVQEAIQKNNT
jgi:hypothetical protein